MNQLLPLLGSYWKTKYGSHFRDRLELEIYQDRQVQNFLKFILPKSKFYRDYYQNLDIKNWQEFPIIDKSIMMENFDTLNIAGISKSEAFSLALKAEETRDFTATLQGYTLGLSSGTSGNRGLFIVSQKEQAAWAGTILAKALPSSLLVPQKIAFFLRANSKLYQTVKRQRIQFQYFDLFKPVEQHLQTLNQYQPSILVAPPSMLRILAEAIQQNQLKIHPTKTISVAEVLDPIDETYCQQLFQQKIHQIYQATEGFLGSTCSYGNLHLNEDILVVQKEYIDEKKGKFIPIITDFRRTTQPILRYRLDDILTEEPIPCPCGSVLTRIQSIEGRKDDVFYLPTLTQEKLIPIFPDFIRRAVMNSSEIIEEYLVYQVNIENLEIALKCDPLKQAMAQELVSQSLQTLWQKMQCKTPNIAYINYPEQREHHQKLRRVCRKFKLNHQGER